MGDDDAREVYVKVKDMAGNLFLCPLDALKTPGEVPEEVLDHCVDDATAGRYAGNIRRGA